MGAPESMGQSDGVEIIDLTGENSTKKRKLPAAVQEGNPVVSVSEKDSGVLTAKGSDAEQVLYIGAVDEEMSNGMMDAICENGSDGSPKVRRSPVKVLLSSFLERIRKDGYRVS